MKTIKRPHALYGHFPRKPGTDDESTHYCPGCGHGIVHKLLAEVLDELELQDRSILISPVGCSVFAYYYFDVGNIQAAHGRAPAVATGVKRAQPDSIVISYQGDGDLAAIGGNNILQAANRGENITVIFINNAIYGMTGGQLAPTSPLGMKTTTTPQGREFEDYGKPMRVAELLAQLDGVSYSTRCAMTTAGEINKTKKSIKKALRYQVERKGFSIVEILSQCPTGWKVDPVESLEWIEKNMKPIFPLGVYKDEPVQRAEPPHPARFDRERVRETVHHDGLEQQTLAQGGAPWHWSDRSAVLELKTAGFGGQGVLLLGELLARSAVRAGVHTTWLPSYGPEMRGGTANCSVVLSVDPIGNPLVEQPDILMAFNRPSLERFAPDLKSGGLLVYDSSLIEVGSGREDIRELGVPATAIADELGFSKAANVVLLGALSVAIGFPSEEALQAVAADLGRTEEIHRVNLEAIERGQAFARENFAQPQGTA